MSNYKLQGWALQPLHSMWLLIPTMHASAKGTFVLTPDPQGFLLPLLQRLTCPVLEPSLPEL